MAYEGYWDEIGNIESENIPESVVLATWETGDVDVVRAWLDNGGAAQLEDRIFITAKHGDRNIAFGTLLTIACESDHPSPIAEMLRQASRRQQATTSCSCCWTPTTTTTLTSHCSA